MGSDLGDYILKLNFGFENVPYVERYSPSSPLTARAKRKPKTMTRAQESYGQGKTTVQVAKDLEQRYHIVETFYAIEEKSITKMLEEAFAEELEDVKIMARPSAKSISDAVTDKIEAKFRRSLTSRAYDGVIPGVPTLASLRGVSHLRQHPYAARAPRPSFIDTGLYQRTFRAWVTED